MGNSHKTASDYEVVNTFRQEEWLNKQKKSNFQIWENASRNLRADVYPIRSEIKPVDLDHYQMRYNNSQDIVKVHNLRIDQQSTMCSKSAQAYVLVQSIPYRLSDVSQLTNLEALSVLKSTYSGFNTLTTFYGPVEPYQDLICFNEQGRTKVWISSNLSSNKTIVEKRENTIGSLMSINTVYVNKILDLVQQKTKAGTFPEKLKNKFRKNNPKSYFQALNIVQQFAGQQNIEIPTKIKPALRKKLNIDSTPLKQSQYLNSSGNILNNQYILANNPKSPLSSSNVYQGFINADRANRTPIKGEHLENSKHAIRATPIQNYQLILESNGIKQLDQSQKIVVSPQKNFPIREIPRPVFHPVNLNQKIFINNIPFSFNGNNQPNQTSQAVINRSPISSPNVGISQYPPHLIQSGHVPIPLGQPVTGQRKIVQISPALTQPNLYHPPPTIVKVEQKTIVVKNQKEVVQTIRDQEMRKEDSKEVNEQNLALAIKNIQENEQKLSRLENKNSYQAEYYEDMGEQQFQIQKKLEELQERKFFSFQNNFKDAHIQRNNSNEFQKVQNIQNQWSAANNNQIQQQPENERAQQFIQHQQNYFPLAGMFRNHKSEDQRNKNLIGAENQAQYDYQGQQQNSPQGEYNEEQYIERQFNQHHNQQHLQYEQNLQQHQYQDQYQYQRQLNAQDLHQQQKEESPVRIRLEAQVEDRNNFPENREQSIHNQSGSGPEQNQTNYVQTSHENLNQNQMSYTSPYQYQFNYQPSPNTNNDSKIPENARYEDIEQYIRNKYRSYIGSDDNSVAKPYSSVAPYSGYAAQIEKVDVGQMASYVESKYDQFTSQDVEFSFRPGIQFGKTEIMNEQQAQGKTNFIEGYQPFKRIQEYEEEDALSPETEKQQQNNLDGQIEGNDRIEGREDQKQQDILDVKNMERSLDKKYSSIKSNQQIKDLDIIKNEQKQQKQQGFDVKKLEENLIRFEESRVGSGNVNQPVSLTSQPRFQTSQVSKIHSIDERLNANRRSSMNKEFTTEDYHAKYVFQNKTPSYQYGRKSRASKVSRQIASIEEKYNKYVKSGGAYLNAKQVLKPKQQNYHQYQDYQYENSSSRMVTGNFGYVDNTKYNDTRFNDNNKYNDKRQYNEKGGQDEYRRFYQGGGANSKANFQYQERREKGSKNSKNTNGLSYEDLRKFMWS